MFSWYPMLNNLFVLKVPIGEKVLRAVLVYLALVVLLRLFGKRELAQLNPFDLVVLLTLSNTVQNAIIGDDNTLLGGLIGAVTLLGTNYLVVRFVFQHRRLDQILAGTPTVLIRNSKIQRPALAKEMLSVPELTAAAHRQGYSDLAEVHECVLEPTGVMSFTGKDPPAEEKRHAELVALLDRLSADVTELKRKLSA
jgi:uncharacterized membrane protein YcaP (DUF421 family)